MSDLVTLDRRHPDFRAYLRGTFSREKRALPVRSLNVRTPTESVTFRLVPVADVRKPSWPVVWLKALRPRSFLLVLVPLLFALSRSAGALDPDVPWMATLGLLSLHAAFLLRNDVQDHLSGFDRVRADRGSRAIQNGWLTAAQVEAASWAFLAMALVSGALVIFARPPVGAVVLAAAVLGGTAFFRRETSFRDLSAGQAAFFLLSGPLLFAGLGLAMSGAVTAITIAAGALWGWIALFPVHLRDFENLIVEGQSGRASLVGRAGFDRGLRVLGLWGAVALVGFPALHAADALGEASPALSAVVFGGALAVALGAIPFFAGRRALKSPAGSEVARLRRRGEYLFDAMVSLWTVEAAWRLWTP